MVVEVACAEIGLGLRDHLCALHGLAVPECRAVLCSPVSAYRRGDFGVDTRWWYGDPAQTTYPPGS